ncbi:MAG: MFS transporter, partial [Pseudomonadota bacterium]
LQWLPKDKAPIMLGWIVSAGALGALISYSSIVLTWEAFDLDYRTVYWASGGFTMLAALFCWFFFPHFVSHTKQRHEIVLKKRYWLYYALQFMAGARRQIFVVFAGFMMVERFGYSVDELTLLYTVNLVLNMLAAPLIGKAVAHFGERRALLFEYTGLVLVFLAYGGIYAFGWGVAIAATLYVLDHLFFALKLALKTYFQKIADPADVAPTAAVAFTINHIAAVFLPVALGLMWLWSPMWVFVLAAVLAATSFGLALLIPHNPEPGRETIFSRGRVVPV